MASLPDLATCKKIGFIVPSSNTALEPITQAIFQSLSSNIICIFTRIHVKTVGAEPESSSQFATDTMVQAARLLADAEPDCILWNGTSGMWLGTGLDVDRNLAQAMCDATGIPCSTTTMATVEALEHLQAKRIAIAVPYSKATTLKLVEFYARCGYEVTTAENLDETPPINLEIAKSNYEDIKSVIRRCASPDCQAIVVACTNWPATALVDRLEEELQVPIIDSISITAWWALRMIDVTPNIAGWGCMLEN